MVNSPAKLSRVDIDFSQTRSPVAGHMVQVQI